MSLPRAVVVFFPAFCNTRKVNGKKFLASLGLCFFVAYAGSIVTQPSIATWYATLNKPFFNPPNWVFGPVWTLLYFFMAVSFYLIWKKGGKAKKAKGAALNVFLVQLSFNFLWSLIFFGFHLPFLGLVTILALWVSIFLTIRAFYKLSAIAAYLLIPYLAWVSFATLLNLFIVLLN